jgi:hypothetical protein
MKTEDLIADLAGRLEPVRPLAPPAVRLLLWALVAAACAGAGLVVFGAKPDFRVALGQAEFLALGCLAVGTAILAGAAALVLAIPGAERSPAMRTTAVTLVAVWLATLLVAIARADEGFRFDSHWPACFSRAVGIGLVPAVVLLAMLRRAAPLRLAWAAGLAAVAATAAGALAVQIICPINDPAHALIGHFAPVATLGAIGAAAAGRLLNVRPTAAFGGRS